MATTDVHDDCLTRTVTLSGYWKKDLIAPVEVVGALNAASISFVLIGSYGLAGWVKEPRATDDVDVLVAARQVKKAVRVLAAALPQLVAVDSPLAVRLQHRATQNVEIDVLKPVRQLYREVFHHTHMVSWRGQQFRVPSLEMAVVMKFAAMTSSDREQAAKYQDAHDFILMVKNNAEVDVAQLTELACLIEADGGKDVLELVRRAKVGEKLNI